MTQNCNDPVVDEIQELRHHISARFDHDPAQLVTFYMELQEQYHDRLNKSTNTVERNKQPVP